MCLNISTKCVAKNASKSSQKKHKFNTAAQFSNLIEKALKNDPQDI